ncbi:hypothetical protein [Terrabacter sp. BE26]|uniref:hypothetical protein n=1 Tax=Terrabacter sp. BE26 TaxID=2898152 RepID=UPI0035BE960F
MSAHTDGAAGTTRLCGVSGRVAEVDHSCFGDGMNGDRVGRLKTSVEVLDAYVAALDRRQEVLNCIFESETVEDAEAAIAHLLGVSGTAAKAVVNMQFRRATRTDRARVIADRDEHRRQLSGLTDD